MKEKLWDQEDAAHYDDAAPSQSHLDAIRATVDVLVDLAGGGPALEFAHRNGTDRPGTRSTWPARGGARELDRYGSPTPREGFRRTLPVTIGDLATAQVPGSFQLVYLVFNTIGNLTTQERQLACFANAAAHLQPGGFFLIENTVLDLRRLPPGENAGVFAHAPGYVGYDRYTDLVAQQAVSHHFIARGDSVRESTTPWRFVWPSGLDLSCSLQAAQSRPG